MRGAGVAPDQQTCTAAAREFARRQPRSGWQAPEAPGPQCEAGTTAFERRTKNCGRRPTFFRGGSGLMAHAVAPWPCIPRSAPPLSFQIVERTEDHGRVELREAPHMTAPRRTDGPHAPSPGHRAVRLARQYPDDQPQAGTRTECNARSVRAQRCWRRTETQFRYPPRVRRPPKRTLRAMLPTTTDRIHRRSQHSPRCFASIRDVVDGRSAACEK